MSPDHNTYFTTLRANTHVADDLVLAQQGGSSKHQIVDQYPGRFALALGEYRTAHALSADFVLLPHWGC
jgi:hypothetical protein